MPFTKGQNLSKVGEDNLDSDPVEHDVFYLPFSEEDASTKQLEALDYIDVEAYVEYFLDDQLETMHKLVKSSNPKKTRGGKNPMKNYVKQQNFWRNFEMFHIPAFVRLLRTKKGSKELKKEEEGEEEEEESEEEEEKPRLRFQLESPADFSVSSSDFIVVHHMRSNPKMYYANSW